MQRLFDGAKVLSTTLLLGVTPAAPKQKPEAKGHHALASKASCLRRDDGVYAGAAYLAALSPELREALKANGQVFLDDTNGQGGTKLLKALVRVERPKREVFALLTQPSTQASYLPNLKESKTVGAKSVDGEVVDFLVSYVIKLEYRTQHWFYPEQSRVEWVLDPSGGDGLREQEGYSQLFEVDERTTLIEYGTHLTATGFIVNLLQQLGQRGGVRDALTAFRKHLNSATVGKDLGHAAPEC
jgi:hypothetical protein